MQPSILRASLGGIHWTDGSLSGPGIRHSVKTLGQLRGIFLDYDEWARMDPNRVIYSVQWVAPVAEETVGGLFWGNTTIEAGCVGDEYFMTHGHYHIRRDRSEFYATIQGSGILLLMDRNRRAWAEEMAPGSMHYVPAGVAHRAVNTGSEALHFVACWPSDAGHDYQTIARSGFSLRVFCRQGKPVIQPAPDQGTS